MFIKLSAELIKEFSIEKEVVSWTELKEKLQGTDDELSNSELMKLLKSSKFMAKLPEIQTEKTVVTSEEYAQLISSSSSYSTTPTKDINTEITQLRSDFAELRRETTWLLNCFFSVIGTAVFVYFVVSFYFDKVESRIVCSIVTGLVLFFIEVLLYIIRY